MDYIDYTEVRIQFVGYRKHFFKDKQYYVYVFEKFMIMGEVIRLLNQTPKTQRPKYYVPFEINTRIKWCVRKTKSDLIIDSFIFPYQKGFKEMSSNHENLLKYCSSSHRLKEMIGLKVTFKGINDFYTPISQIGKGSSAKVYSAQNNIEKKIYAVKAIEKSFLKLQSESGYVYLIYNQAAFKMEVEILKLISKYPQNFITLKEIFESDNTHFLVTTFLEGTSLSEELLKSTKVQRLPISNIKMIMKKLLLNLSILHDHKVIHRDLKPDNLMFLKKNDFSSLVLVDFGLATSESMEKFLFPKCGTPGYVAPEILNLGSQNRYTSKVDIFSCGCIFYRLLTGKSLFEGNTFENALKQNRKCQIELDLPLDSHLTELSLNLLQQMLIKNPKNRITAKAALSHPFFDQIIDNSTFLQLSIQSPKFTIKFEQQSFDSFEKEQINNEKEIHDYIEIPKSKRCSLMGELSFSKLQDTQRFYLQEPLSAMKVLKVTQSPQVSQVLE